MFLNLLILTIIKVILMYISLRKLSIDLNKHQDNGMGDLPTFSLIKNMKENKLIRCFLLRNPLMTSCLCRFM